MRVGMVLDWQVNATSLTNLVTNMFKEIGQLMNDKKSFTITGLLQSSLELGDINQHFDCVHIPNMGGYKFPNLSALSCDNLIVSLSGIDEVVLGREVFKTEQDWKKFKPIIDKEVSKWKKYGHKFKAVHLVTNSEKQDVMKFFEIPEEKIHIIPHGVNHDIFKPPKDKFSVRKKILSKFFIKDNPFFIHVSESNWARKNIKNILEGFKKAKNLGISQNLLIIGKNDPIVYEWAQSIPGVYIIGFVKQEHLVEFLGAADGLILPSKHEGFGLPLLEAMACGTPSITSKTFSPPHVIGESGILVDPYNVSEIAEKIVELGKNEHLRDELSKKALKRSENYSWKKNAESLYDLYKQVTKKDPTKNFDENLDLAGFRTLVTIVEIKPQLKAIATLDLLKFDYSRIINWALTSGLEDPDVKDYLIPFEDWLVEKRRRLS